MEAQFALTRIFLIALLSRAMMTASVQGLDFSFSSFKQVENSLRLNNSNLLKGAIQVTPDLSNALEVMNMSGRTFYKEGFTLWRKGKGGAMVTASFDTTFDLNISPFPDDKYPIGEGLAFIMTGDLSPLKGGQGRWLGIVNSNETLPPEKGIVAVEFDTRKSFPQDIDDNHVGLDVNSIYSTEQVSLTGYGLNISGGVTLTVRIRYDEKNISVFVSRSNETGTGMKTPVISVALNISDHLPQKVYVGFSASTGENTFQRNCVKSWHFHSTKIDRGPDHLWVFVVVPIVVVLVGLAFCLYWKRSSRKGDVEEAYPGLDKEIPVSSMGPKKFKLRELQEATGNFSPENELGTGGFGTVYKGLVSGEAVAVKRFGKDSSQGKQEFVNEVTTIGNLRHKNLVRLVGFCYESNELLIVYEFMPNLSLDKVLFGDEKLGIEARELPWETRSGILKGTADGLDYLHNGGDKQVLHRDVKSSNIMLNDELTPKVGDFGLARTIQRSEKSHHSTREIAGTKGYMAPESFFTGRATVETDVYAFGVLVLEVVSGRKPVNQSDQSSFNNGLVNWIWGLYNNGRILEAVDPRLNGEFHDDDMACMIVLGLGCCHPNRFERPTMRTILKVLAGEEAPPLLPEEMPVFVWPQTPPSFKDNDGDTTLQGSQLTPFTEITGR